ncbi:MAG TPA: ABC transporter permease [Haploplasma sp.]|nr:ABC transporter permease [Haploplasma sp.]
MHDIDKDKFKLVDPNKIFYDEQFQTQGTGYYKDAYNRFKKNKASVVAAIILIILFFLTIFGPLFSPHNSKYVNNELKEYQLPARVQLIEKLGFLDGEKLVHKLTEGEMNELRDLGILKKIDSIETIMGQKFYNAKVDYYKYTNHKLSQEYYLVSEDKYQRIKDKPYIIDSKIDGSVRYVKVHYFAYAFDKDDINFTPYFWFGTDMRGRDVFSNLWVGAGISLLVAFSVSLVNIVLGIILGSIAGYYGGKLDLAMERVIEVISGIPFMAVLTLLLLRFGNGFGVVIFAFTVTGWIGIYSMVRTQFYRYKNREYVLAARTLGASDIRIMSRHIFPSAIGTIVTSLVLYIPGIIFTEATYSFLGVINYGDFDSIGRMLSTGQEQMQFNPHLLIFPSIFISLLMLSFNLFGNGLRDAFNPSLRGVE